MLPGMDDAVGHLKKFYGEIRGARRLVQGLVALL